MTVNGTFTESGKLESVIRALSRDENPGCTWHDVAVALEELIALAQRDQWQGDAQIRTIAEGSAKLSWAILTRYLSAARRLRTVATREEVAIEELLSPGFNALEAAIRLYERHRDDGLTALRDLHYGRQTLAGVRRSLEFARAGNAVGSEVSKSLLLRKRASELKLAEAALHKDGSRLFGNGCSIIRRPPLQYFRQFGVDARVDGLLVGGGNVFTQDAGTRSDRFDVDLPASLLLAQYYPRFFLIFSQGADTKIMDRAEGALENFGATHVGVAYQQHSKLEIIRQVKNELSAPADYELLRDRLLRAENKSVNVSSNALVTNPHE